MSKKLKIENSKKNFYVELTIINNPTSNILSTYSILNK